MTAHQDTHVSYTSAHHDRTHRMADATVLSVSLAVFSLVTYFLCIGLALAFPPMAESMKVLYPAMFPGFVWLTADSIAWGAVFLTIAALYVGCGFALIYNLVCRIVRS